MADSFSELTSAVLGADSIAQKLKPCIVFILFETKHLIKYI